jgi:hypothetical protein
MLSDLRDVAEQEERALNTVIVRACRAYMETDPEAKKKARRG